MSRTVIDASVAIKWVVEENGTPEALALLNEGSLLAPDLLIPECANILWKKVGRSKLEKDEAIMAARLLQRSDVEIVPTRSLMEQALKLSIDLEHAAYDCGKATSKYKPRAVPVGEVSPNHGHPGLTRYGLYDTVVEVT